MKGNNMKIILDGMGGDNAPREIVKGAVLASKEIDDEIIIVGNRGLITQELKNYDYDESKISIVHSTEVITCNEAPVMAIRRKKDSSIVKGLKMLKEKEGDVFISAGSTGAVFAGGVFILGKIKGIDRPALTVLYPILGGKHPTLLLDIGANADCKPRNLLEFAIMGSIYMEKVMNINKPKVALVNIGAEEEKGSILTKESHELIKDSKLNFIGNIEGRDVPYGIADVMVTDGFTGNTIIKLTEGFALKVFATLKQKFMDGIKAKVGSLILHSKMKEIKSEFNYSEYGGAPILGVNGSVVKMHGSSDSLAVKNAIIKSIPFVKNEVAKMIEETI